MQILPKFVSYTYKNPSYQAVPYNFINDYEGAEEGTENVCFDRCIEIIKRALDSGVEQATEGIAKTSLSL
jgi:hypothetical protein